MSTPQPGVVQRSSFSSDDEAEVTEFIRRMYAEHRTRFAPIADGARFSASVVDTPLIGGDRVRTSIDYDGTSAAGFTDYVFFVVHAGSVEIRSRGGGTTASRGDVSFYPLDVPVDFAVRGIDVSVLRLASQDLHQVAEDTTGVPAAEVAFHDVTPISPSMHRCWRSVLDLVGAAMADPASPLDSVLLTAGLARHAAVAALSTFPNTTMTRQHEPGPGHVAPAAIRRAMAHLEAHAHLPVDLREVAAAAGTSARALQYGFRRHLDTTPLGYLRRVRLERAHRDLQAGDPTAGDTVAAIAARWGYAHPGRFSVDYRRAYGRGAVETLRR